MPLRRIIKQRIEELSGQINRLLSRNALDGTPAPVPPRLPGWNYDEWVPTLWADVDLEINRHLRGPRLMEAPYEPPIEIRAAMTEAFRTWPERRQQLVRNEIVEAGDALHYDTVDGVPYPRPYFPRRPTQWRDDRGPAGGVYVPQTLQEEIMGRRLDTEPHPAPSRISSRYGHTFVGTDMVYNRRQAGGGPPPAGNDFWIEKMMTLQRGDLLLYVNDMWSVKPVLCRFYSMSDQLGYMSDGNRNRYFISVEITSDDILQGVDDHAEFFAVPIITP